MTNRRLVDPLDSTAGYASRQLGVKGQRDQTNAMNAGDRITTERSIPFRSFETLMWHEYNITSNATTSFNIILTTSATTVGEWSNPALPLGSPGRIVSVRLGFDTALLTGTATPIARIAENGSNTDYTFDDCIVDSGVASPYNQQNHVTFPWKIAPTFDKGATLLMRVITTVYTPTTAEVVCWVTIGYEDAKL